MFKSRVQEVGRLNRLAPTMTVMLAGSPFQIEQLFTGSLIFGESSEHFENQKRNAMDCLSRGFFYLDPSCIISSRNQPISGVSFWGLSFSGKNLQLRWSVVVKNNSVWPSSLAMTGKREWIGRYPFIVLFCYNSSGE